MQRTSSGVELELTFSSPLLPGNFRALTSPTSFVWVEVRVPSGSGKGKEVQVYLDSTAEVVIRSGKSGVRDSWCSAGDNVTWDRHSVGAAHRLGFRMGKAVQEPLCESGDEVNGNWGWVWLVDAVGGASGSVGVGLGEMQAWFGKHGTLPPDSNTKPRSGTGNSPPAAGLVWDLGVMAPGASRRVGMVFAIDDVLGLDFYTTPLSPWWRSYLPLNSSSSLPLETLAEAVEKAEQWRNESDGFDAQVAANASTLSSSQATNDALAYSMALAFRQAMGAGQWLWHHERKEVWYALKEQSTNGDLSTTDVIWPTAPVLALYAPWMLRRALLPHFLLDSNQTNTPYSLNWTSHQLGTWPLATSGDDQEYMPIETCADMAQMLLMAAAREAWDVRWLHPFLGLLEQWGWYLVRNLPNPPAQKITNDFLGPQPGFVDLSAKGTLGLYAYAHLLDRLNHSTLASTFRHSAVNYSRWWSQNALFSGEEIGNQEERGGGGGKGKEEGGGWRMGGGGGGGDKWGVGREEGGEGGREERGGKERGRMERGRKEKNKSRNKVDDEGVGDVFHPLPTSSPPHTLYLFGDRQNPDGGAGSWMIKYSLQFLRHLQSLGLGSDLEFSETVLEADFSFLLSTKREGFPFGLPYNTNHNVSGGPTWQAMLLSSTLRLEDEGVFHHPLALWGFQATHSAYLHMGQAALNGSAHTGPMPDMFDAATLQVKGATPGKNFGMRARPCVGEIFQPLLLALTAQNKTWTVDPPPDVPNAYDT